MWRTYMFGWEWADLALALDPSPMALSSILGAMDWLISPKVYDLIGPLDIV
jgi:hypothetical protein